MYQNIGIPFQFYAAWRLVLRDLWMNLEVSVSLTLLTAVTKVMSVLQPPTIIKLRKVDH